MERMIRAAADGVFPDVVRLRRTIHRHPELAFREERRAALIPPPMILARTMMLHLAWPWGMWTGMAI